MHETIFVTGGTGFVGRHLISQLLTDCKSLCVFSRNADPEKLRDLKNHFGNRLSFSFGDISKNIMIPEKTTTIFHCAGIISDESQMKEVNIDGTRNIVEAALDNGCRLIYLSSAGVVGKTKEHMISEETPCHPDNTYEWSKFEAEKIVLDGVARGLKARILRPTIIVGPGRPEDKDSFLHLLRAIKHGHYRNIRNGIYNIVHVDEVVRVMRLLDNEDTPDGSIFIINSPIYFRRLADIIRLETKVRPEPVGNIPYAFALLAAAGLTLMSAATRRNMPLTLSRLRALTNKKVFQSSRLVDVLAYQPLHSIEEYVRDLCWHYQEKGLL